MPYGVLKFDWVVNIKPVDNGQAVLKYLTHRTSTGSRSVTIESSRSMSLDVHYKVKPSGETQYQTRRLSGESFVRSFAQHILSSGFKKIRYYGFMSPNCKLQLADARWLVWLWLGWTFCLNSVFVTPPVPESKAAKVSALQRRNATVRNHQRRRPLALAHAGDLTRPAKNEIADASIGVRTEMTTASCSHRPLQNDVAKRHAGDPARGCHLSPLKRRVATSPSPKSCFFKTLASRKMGVSNRNGPLRIECPMRV